VKFLKQTAILLFISIFTVACSDSDTDSSNTSRSSATSILAVGDSIGVGYSVETQTNILPNWPTKVQDKTGIPVINYSKGGRHASASISTVQYAIDTYQPSHLIIMLGTNDSNNGSVSGATFAMQFITEYAKAAGVVPIIGTIPPRNSKSAEIAANYRQIDTPIADIEAAFGNGSGLFQSDGIHPNDAGQEVIANTFVDVLNAN